MDCKCFGVARILNKRGYCSRSRAELLVRSGSVCLNGIRVLDPETPAKMDSRITVDGVPVKQKAPVYLLMHKPRGVVTTALDEKGRQTVMDLLKGKNYPHLFPVGRLDKASEGLLILTNDTAFANKILSPESHLEKEYHVQVSRLPSESEFHQMQKGVWVPPRVFGEKMEWMKMAKVDVLRKGDKSGWISVVLQEGKNREIRRILQIFSIDVLRLIRVRIGTWTLGSLKPGEVENLERE